MATQDDVTDLISCWYGDKRFGTPMDRGAAASLIDHHGWTPARAALVAQWIEDNPRGRFWADKTKNIPDVLRNVVSLTEQSGAEQEAAPRQPPIERSPEEEAHLTHIGTTSAQLKAETEAPWIALLDEAKAKGLRGPKMFDWVMSERAKRTGRPRSDYPTSREMARDLAKPAPYADPSPKHWTEREEARSNASEECEE